MKTEGIVQAIVIGVLVVLFVGIEFGSCFAPCSWYGCSPAKEMPARCLKEMLPR